MQWRTTLSGSVKIKMGFSEPANRMSGPIDWAVSAVINRIFCFRPRFQKSNGQLIARSGWRSQILTLGIWNRRVTVDPAQKILRIRSRVFWVFSKSRRIQFDWVKEILYTYRDIGGSSWSSHQEQDLYTVGLLLKSGEEVKLFRFYGAGDYVPGIWPQWMVWDDHIEAAVSRTSQDDTSLIFAEILSAMMGVPIGRPIH